MNITVRRALDKDIPYLTELLTQVNMVHHEGRPDIFDGPAQKYDEEQLKVLIRDDTRPVFVGVDDQDEVHGYGFCVMIVHEGDHILRDRKELYIDDLCVDQKDRGEGVGKQIFAYIKEYAKEQGCYHVTLNVWACNPGAMKFYEALGMTMLKKEMELIL